jgi:hypothetical protein
MRFACSSSTSTKVAAMVPPQLLGRLQGVVSGQHLHRAPVDHDRAVLAVGPQAGLDRLDVAAAGVARVSAQVGERNLGGLELGIGHVRARLSDARRV